MTEHDNKPCMYCKGGVLRFSLCEKSVHYGELRCLKCKRHGGYVPKPSDDPTKYRRPQAHRDLVKKFSRGFCEMCRTLEVNLPKGRALEAHHVIEFQEGGEPTRENTWILCTACHKLVNWRRTYESTAVVNVAEAMTQWQE